MNMALYPSTRISLKFNDINNYQCWFLVDHQKIPCVSHLQQHINSRFYNNVKGKIILTLKGSLIPPWESSLILRDDDQIVVQKENGNIEVKCFGNKKRKKKLDSSLKNDSITEIDAKANDIIFISENKANPLGNCKKEYSSKKKDKTKKRKYLDVKEKQEEYLEETERIEEHSEKREKKKKKEYAEKKEKNKSHTGKEEHMEMDEEHVEKKEHTTKKRKKEIEVYEEDPPLVSVESKKKKKRKSVTCDDVPVVKLDFENSPKELVEKDQKRQEKKNQKLHKLCKSQSTGCDQHKEIVIDDEEEEGEEKYNNNKGNNSDVNKEIIIDDDEEEEEDKANVDKDNDNENRDLENNNIEIISIVSLPKIPDNQKTLQNSDLCEKTKSSQEERISLSTISPISTTHQEMNSDIIIDSSKKNIPVKETIEVFDISNENLTAICKAVEEGESLTVNESKAKRIQLCPSMNENVLNMDNIVRNEKLPINKTTEKNGSKPHRRRPRKRRHGPSFACAPFIQAMSSYSEGDASSLNSTPKTTLSQHSNSLHSSRNISDKHIHFDSSDESEGTASNIISACDGLEPSHSTPISVNSLKTDNHKIQLPNMGNPLISETSESQSELDNCSIFSIRNALQKNSGVYQRGLGFVKSSQISSSAGIIQQDKPQTEIYLKDKQLQNKNQAQLSSSVLKPNYDVFPPLRGIPCVGDRIAFKRLEIGIDYSPVISDFREATVLAFEDETKMIALKFHTSRELKRTDGKFELCFEAEEVKNTEDEADDDMETVSFGTLMEVKLLSKS